MTVTPSIDPARLLEEQLAQASPDLLRELLTTFINTLMSAEADAVCGAAYGQASPDRTNRRNGYRARDFDTRAGTLDLAVPKLRAGYVLPGVAAGASQARRAGAHLGGGDLLPARRLDPPDGQAGAVPGDHHLVQEPGQRDGQGPRRARRGVPHPPARSTPGRSPSWPPTPGAQGPRGRPRRRRARPGRHRCQRRRAPGDPRPARHHQRGRRRLAGLLPRPDRPRPDRGQARHLRRPRRPGRRDRRDPARRGLATLPHPLRRQPDVDHPEELVGLGQGAAALDLRPARRRGRARPVRPGRRRPGREAPRRRRAPRDRPRRHPRLHRASPRRSGARSGPTTPTNASTARSAAAPTSSASSPTAARSSDSSAPSWPSNTTNGPKAAATSDSTSWPDPRPSHHAPRR